MVRGVMVRGMLDPVRMGLRLRGLFNTAVIPPSVWSVHMRVGFMGVVWCCGDLIFCLGSEESLK